MNNNNSFKTNVVYNFTYHDNNRTALVLEHKHSIHVLCWDFGKGKYRTFKAHYIKAAKVKNVSFV